MKKYVILIFLFLSLTLSPAQQIIVNPGKPLSKKAGRELKLQEVFRITDESGDFYFKMFEHFGNVKVAQDGTFFVSDENQLLKFSPQGKFIKNLLKTGQGPGEISSGTYNLHFYLAQNSIYVQDGRARKIVNMDMDGNLIKEKKLAFEGVDSLYSLLGLSGDEFVFIHQENIRFDRKSAGFYDLEMSVFLVSPDGTKANKIFSFPRKTFGAPSFGMEWAPFEVIMTNDNQELFVNSTCEYQITHASLEEGRILNTFGRKYPRIKHVTQAWEEDRIKKHDAPKRIYENDIAGLFLHKGLLWVKTSTIDMKKGLLIDVFDSDGNYVDCFYLSIPDAIKAVWDNHIFTVEKDRDENVQIVQYKIIE